MVINGKKSLFVVSIFISLTLLFMFSFQMSAQAQDKVFKIGISQFVEHPALDSAREGFIESLSEAGFVEGENIEINLENAQADFSTTQTIAQKFKGQNLDLVLAIATPNAQSAAGVLTDTPLIITAVTDPVAAGLVEDLENKSKPITGTTDMNPVAKQLELIKQFVPSAEKIGILYNSGEVNSVVQVDIAKEAAADMGLEIVEGTVTNTSEVTLATSSIVGKVDAIYLPTDNTIASAVPSIMKIAKENNVPVFAAEKGQVENGAIATRGIDYFTLGKETGQIAARVLNGEDPVSIPITGSKNLQLIVNKKSVEEFNLEIPSSLEEEIDILIE
ncbi:MAG TPA: ABC transporter substrate-binding protein [Halanaerobiales bacterium]|nr:ABC transporter substrate-binding protein [Halanaerobiales bacterium]